MDQNTVSYHKVAESVESQLEGSEVKENLRVSQSGPTLFGPIKRSYLCHIFNGHPILKARKLQGNGWIYAKDLPSHARRSLLSKLYWIRRCKPSVQCELYRLASSDQGWTELRRIFVSCEMRITTIILADPNQPYEFFDQINCSLISNSLNQKNFHKFLKSVIKKCRKAVLSGEKPDIPRSCSWITRVIKAISNKVTKRLREITLLQTRAAGYPNKEIRQDSLQSWIDTTTSQPDVDLSLLTELTDLERYVNETMQVNAFTVRHTHVSLGGGSCLESTKKSGGKTVFARNLIRDVKSCSIVDLDTGEITYNHVFADAEPGEFLFHYSLLRFLENQEKLLTVRVTGIDEVGMKYRIITVPSFYHSTILSPWAHLTYQFLKTSPETRDGVAGTNHAWRMSLALTASDPDADWLFKPEANNEVFCSDLEAATDSTYHPAIEAIVETIQAIMPVKNWYHETVKSLLASSRPFSVQMENEIVRGHTTRGAFMGDHGSKTLLTLSGVYALAGMPSKRISRIVGDDQATVCESAGECGVIYRQRMESLGYKISEDDTFVSKTCFFAEDAFDIPTDPGKTTEVYTFRKARSRLPFHDVPKAKILVDPGKDEGLFSETAIGKITLLAVRMEQSGKTYSERQFHLASWMQDLSLGLLYRKEFVYFPRFLVQTGKPPLFGCKDNVKSFLRMQRCGRLTEHYADIMRQSLDGDVRSINRFIVQSFFTHAKGDEHIRILEREFDDQRFEECRVLTSEAVRGFEPFLVGRLSSHIISESEITMKLAEREMLLGEKPPTSRLLVDTLGRGGAPLTHELMNDFIDLWVSNSKLLRLRHRERYYDREAVGELLDLSHPLRVNGLLKELPLEEKSELLRSEHDREVKKLYDWVIANPQRLDDIPRALIRDDPILLSGDYLTIQFLLVVSDDSKLVQYCANLRGFNWRTSTKITFTMSIHQWVLADLTADPWFPPENVFLDEGSLDGYCDKMDREERDIPGPDGGLFINRFRPVRPNRGLKIPQDVMELATLRGPAPSIPE
jgi:hypothetical protein